MSDKYYIRSVHERLINTKKYINCFTKRDKQELKVDIKYVERLLDPKIIISRNDGMRMMERPNLFIRMLIDKMYIDIMIKIILTYIPLVLKENLNLNLNLNLKEE